MERIYPNQFARIGVSDEEVLARVEAAFQTIFFDPAEKFYHEVDADSACMEDTGNHDARTEGMSYGMMMAVQMNRQDIFDKLWTFSDRYMRQRSGKYEGYFAWSVQLNGVHNAEGPAPDGEEYFAMALFLASARWGDGEGLFNYGEQARTILRHCVHQHEMAADGQPMWDPDNHHIRFVPEALYTDPSYHLPHFYQVFAERADPCDRTFWQEAARVSRAFIASSAHPVTGMSAEYTEYDGTTRLMFRKPWAYYSDAYRVAMNIALDTLWNGRCDATAQVVTRLQDFFAPICQDDFKAYHLDGAAFDEPAMHPVAITAVLGAASIASHSAHADEWLRRFWAEPLRKGNRRYYDNCLYFFCLLMLSGLYRIYYGGRVMTTLMANTIYALTRKGFPVHHAATMADARSIVMNLIGEADSVGFGGSVTIREMGLYEQLKEMGRNPHWHWKNDEPKPEVFALAAQSEVYLTSSNAITADGSLVNIDGTGNRVGAMIAGPKQVIVVAGANKLVNGGIPQALARIKSVACPLNARRLGLDTPCAREDRCDAANCTRSMCNVTSIIERPVGGHKITVVLVDEETGY